MKRLHQIVAAIAGFALLFRGTTTAFAAIITVTSASDNGAGTLRQALVNAGNGDAINFSLMLPATITLTSGELLVATNLTITGPGATNLVISAGTNSRVFNIATNHAATLSGLTLRDGHAGTSADGGGIYNAGTLTLSNCVVGFNVAGDGSGGGSNPGANGGGIFNSGSLTVVACTFRSNSAGTGGPGNSLSPFGHSLTPGGVGGNGGGIFNSGSLTLISSTFNDNSGGTGGRGGGTSVGGSGASGGTGGNGGGIFNAGLLNCTSGTFSGNHSGLGGPGGLASGVFSGGSNGPRGGLGGCGGIYNSASAASAILRNTLIALNSSGTESDLFGGFTSQGRNFVGMLDASSGTLSGGSGDATGSLFNPINPLLGALQDNGGPTPTMAPLTGSPAVDAGDDTLTGTDQRGFPRLNGPHVDIGAFEGVLQASETLWVGDGIYNTVSRIEIRSRASLGTFVPAAAGASYQMVGPRGMLCVSNLLLVVNQNVDTPFNGEVLKFDANTGSFAGKLVPSSNPNAPYAPRGIIAGPDGSIYVADLGGFDGVNLGRVARFNMQGQFLGNLDKTGLATSFYPMALVVGPDGMLYVSGVGNLSVGESSGYVFRFQYNSGTHDFHYHDTVVASTPGNFYGPGLHAPEGLAFGPDGNLYVTSFYAQYTNGTGSNIIDPDAILVFNTNGQRIGSSIVFDSQGVPRVFAQALVFGPRGDLFLATTSGAGVRRYSASSNYQQFTVLPASGAAPQQPWYLTFRATDPRTLTYQPPSLSAIASSNRFDVSWPAGYVGWKLQVQTNALTAGLATNWADVSETTTTNDFNTSLNLGYNVFYRLTAP
jgi:hypothetical protein